MDKKALRKELELALIKSIEDTLAKRNAIAGKQIREKVMDASKKIAKKFYKALHELNEKKLPEVKTELKKATTSKKKPVKKAPSRIPAKKKK